MNKRIKQFLCNRERENFKKQEAEQQAMNNKTYPNVYQISNVYYGHGVGPDQDGLSKEIDPDYKMDVFYDNNVQIKHPIIISIHGGGLMTGNKEFNKHMCLEFATQEFLVYTIEYPKIPEHTIDEMLKAVVMAINMIVTSATYMDGDPANVFIVGDSAGAFLTVYATAIIHNPKLAKELGIDMDLTGIRIKGLGLISGLFYTAGKDFYGFFYKALLYGKDMKNDALRKYCNPELSDVITILPPCMLITSEGDFLKKHSFDFYKALQSSGNQCLLEYYPDQTLVHDFPVFQSNRVETENAIRKISRFFWDCSKEE